MTKQRKKAWAVHGFTATGAVFGFLALVSLLSDDLPNCFLWLGVALFVDGVDGTLARRYKVSEYVPEFDGVTLDNVIDYFTYVIVPAMIVYWYDMVPAGWELIAAGLIVLVSTYTFSNANMKSDDYYFVGFPALWNVVALYFYLLDLPQIVNLIVIAICGVLTFVPWKYVHPMRVERLRPLSIVITTIWGASILLLVVEKPLGGIAMALFLLSSIYFALLCAARTLQDYGFEFGMQK